MEVSTVGSVNSVSVQNGCQIQCNSIGLYHI